MSEWHSSVDGSIDRVSFTEAGRLDEVYASHGSHLEHLGGNRWFLLFSRDDGTEFAVWFTSKDLRRPFMELREPRVSAPLTPANTDVSEAGS